MLVINLKGLLNITKPILKSGQQYGHMVSRCPED